MKINISFVLGAIIGTLGVVVISVANQINNTPLDHRVLNQDKMEQVEHDPNLEDSVITNSAGSWGRHEPLKSCAPCHDVSHALRDGDQTEQTSLDKLPLVAKVPELCFTCHEKYVTLGAWVHGPVATGECLLCHEPHKASNTTLLSKPIPDLCYRCHETKTLQLIPNHANKSYQRCNDCHTAHTSPGRMLLNEDFLKTNAGLVYLSKNPSAQPRPILVDRRDSLSGLEGVEVIPVIDGLELFKRYGASEDLVKTEVERQLQRNSIKILQPQEQTSKRSSLYVHLRLMEVPSFRRPGQVDAVSGSFNLYLQQTVELLPSPGDTTRRYCTATTWDTGAILIWGTSQIDNGLENAVEVLVGRFSKDYLAANPKAHFSMSIPEK